MLWVALAKPTCKGWLADKADGDNHFRKRLPESFSR